MTDFENYPFEACDHCGTPFQQDVSYPVVTQQEDGNVTFKSFCDEECQTAWASDD